MTENNPETVFHKVSYDKPIKVTVENGIATVDTSTMPKGTSMSITYKGGECDGETASFTRLAGPILISDLS